MNKDTDKKKTPRNERDDLRKSLASPAWGLWTELAKGDVMANTDGREQMMERHKIVVALIEVNSQQLRCDSASAGLDIERLIARRDVEQSGSTQAALEALHEIERRTAEIEDKKRKLNQERDWLESSLSEFDVVNPDRSANAREASVRKPS
jgi:hypothetical protein